MDQMPDWNNVKTVIIGTWGHAGAVLHELNQAGATPDFTGLAPVTTDDDPENLKKNFPPCSHAPIYEDYRTMLSELSPDLAIISTRIDLIGEIALEAAQAGCHTICEKPFAVDREALRKHYDLLENRRLGCIAMLNNQVHPVIAAARQEIESGSVGKIVLCNAQKSYKFGSRPEWFGKREKYGGTIPWVGIHALDFINAATGLYFVKVAAMHSNLAHKSRPGCEDNCVINLELSNGAHATVSIDYLRPETADTHGDARLRVAGSRGVIEAYIDRNICNILAEDDVKHEITLKSAEPFYTPVIADIATGRYDRIRHLTARSFMLTDAALAARDCADRQEICRIDAGPWHTDLNRIL